MQFNKLILSCVIIFSSITAWPCTTLTIQAKDGSVLQGRTMELGVALPFDLSYYPKAMHFNSTAPSGFKPVTYNSKYSFVGATVAVKDGNAILADGINSAGLTFSLQYGPKEPRGLTITDKTQTILNSTDIGTWALSQFSNINELKDALKTQPIWPGPVPTIGEKVSPFHYAFFDRNDKGIVVEFVGGKQLVYDNPVHVMTNGPSFPWHLTNLDNYAFTGNIAKNSQIFGNYKATAIDVGSNLAGLPSDDTSTGRFVRAAYYSEFTTKPASATDGMITIAKIMNKFDRIHGASALQTETTPDSTKHPQLELEWTLYTILLDLKNSVYYIRPGDSLNYVKIDLNKIKNINTMKSIGLDKLPTANSVFDFSGSY